MAPSSDYIAVIKDPWEAPPSGIADEFSNPTTALKVKSAFTLTTNNAGNAAFVLTPSIAAGALHSYVATVTAATDTITAYTGTTHPDSVSLAAQFQKYRPVSMGVKVFYTGAESTTAGLITLSVNDGIGVNGVPSTILLPTAISEWADLPNAKTVACAAMTEPLACRASAFDRPSFDGLNQAHWALYFPDVLVGITGAAISLACIRIEATLNLELIPLMTAFAAHHGSVTVPHDPSTMVTARRLGMAVVGTPAEVVSHQGYGGVKRPRNKSRAGEVAKRRSRPALRRMPPRMMSYRTGRIFGNTRRVKRKGGRRRRTLFRRR
jgi:hypothetical protein